MRSPGALHLQLGSKTENHERRITKNVLLYIWPRTLVHRMESSTFRKGLLGSISLIVWVN